MTDRLIDKFAFVRVGNAPGAATWADRIERGLVRISTVTWLELGYSARSGRELREEMRRTPVAGPAIPAIPDLLVAATAELAGLVVLHLDEDFDLSAELTGQSVEQLAPHG